MCCDYKGFHNIWSLSLTNNGCLFPSLNKKQLFFSLYKQKDSQQIDCKITFFLSSQQSYSFNWSSFIAEPCSISLFVFCLSFCIQQEIKSVTLKRPSNKIKMKLKGVFLENPKIRICITIALVTFGKQTYGVVRECCF